MNNSKVLYNQKCSICNYEIQHYKKRSSLSFVDCSEMEDKYLKKLHVSFDNGTELSGVDAFIYVWKNTKGYNWLGKLISVAPIKQVAKICYAIIALLLFWRFKLFVK